MIDFTRYDYTTRLVPSYAGLRIIQDINMTETVEDWSRVRSPGRARRRRKLGHPQNIVYREVPNKNVLSIGDALVMHPEIAKAFERLMQEQATKIHDKMLAEACVRGESMSRTSLDAGGALTMEHITKWRLT